MEIRVLRYFLTVVREESITKASEVLHITQPTLSRQLAQMEEDIGEPVDMEKYEFIRLNIREQWGVLMKSDDPLSKKETVSAKDLSVLPLILPRRMNVQSELASWFGNYYEKLDIVFTSNLSTNSAIMVNGGLAYSLVIEGAVPFWNQSKVTFRPLDPPLTATSVLAWKRGQPFSLATTKFIKHIQCFLGMDKP